MTLFSLVTLCAPFLAGVLGVYRYGVSQTVNEGESVTLQTGVEINKQEKLRWYFNDILIAELNRDLSYSCTDFQCKDADTKFRNRLKLDRQTGSLTIKDTRTTDSGVYKLKITRKSGESVKLFIVAVHGFFNMNAEGESTFVMEGDSLTLHTDVETNQQETIRWYFNDARIAQMTGDLSYICTDVQCNEDTKTFRHRLNLDHQTGSLTITNTRTTDSGVYRLRIISSHTITEKIFIFAVYDAPAAERNQMKRKSVMEGESVTLDPGEMENLNYLMTWYFNDIRIAQITGDPNKTCTYGQCEDADGRFRDRLEVNPTGSLTITNTTTTDSGLYKLQFNSSSRISIIKIFSVTVTAVPDPTVASGAKEGRNAIVVVVVLLFVAAAVAVPVALRQGSPNLVVEGWFPAEFSFDPN
ncbi:Carcinoembryonic antigen-related cell adhesion molecule 3 [Labeo rohita]|uniref:Carcinoembryonic antigen-related cell adhesion molecule 3 n=1 Tax=Labeo rohita TaxID=84645 RepID=A0ABQ8LJ14_LABRO|nr:Carcinoembryonic antigen-related cell adhesion molecule 3 [Labeo rohita]